MNQREVVLLLAVFVHVTHSINPQCLPIEYSGLQGREELVERYFMLNFNCSVIIAFLALGHGALLSLRHLKRILRRRSSRRRGQPSDGWDVIAAIEKELSGSGSSIGYGQMHQRLQISHHLQVDRETVRQIVKALDPDGVEIRSRRKLQRQKYRSWHIDGYDKLKPFGFCIHGAIDGYSRRILWLQACLSNNDPWVIAGFYLKYIRFSMEEQQLLFAEIMAPKMFLLLAFNGI